MTTMLGWRSIALLQSSPKAGEVSCRTRAERCPSSEITLKIRPYALKEFGSPAFRLIDTTAMHAMRQKLS